MTKSLKADHKHIFVAGWSTGWFQKLSVCVDLRFKKFMTVHVMRELMIQSEKFNDAIRYIYTHIVCCICVLLAVIVLATAQ